MSETPWHSTVLQSRRRRHDADADDVADADVCGAWCGCHRPAVESVSNRQRANDRLGWRWKWVHCADRLRHRTRRRRGVDAGAGAGAAGDGAAWTVDNEIDDRGHQETALPLFLSRVGLLLHLRTLPQPVTGLFLSVAEVVVLPETIHDDRKQLGKEHAKKKQKQKQKQKEEQEDVNLRLSSSYARYLQYDRSYPLISLTIVAFLLGLVDYSPNYTYKRKTHKSEATTVRKNERDENVLLIGVRVHLLTKST